MPIDLSSFTNSAEFKDFLKVSSIFLCQHKEDIVYLAVKSGPDKGNVLESLKLRAEFSVDSKDIQAKIYGSKLLLLAWKEGIRAKGRSARQLEWWLRERGAKVIINNQPNEPLILEYKRYRKVKEISIVFGEKSSSFRSRLRRVKGFGWRILNQLGMKDPEVDEIAQGGKNRTSKDQQNP